MHSLVYVLIGIIIGIMMCLFYIKYLKRNDFTKPVLIEKSLKNNVCIKETFKTPLKILSESSLIPKPKSLILNIENKELSKENISPYYEVSIFDKNDKLLWVKENISQVDLSQFTSKKELKYKIFNPLSLNLECSTYEIPFLNKNINPSSDNLKEISEIEIDYQEVVVDKIFKNHFNSLNIKKVIYGIEIKDDFNILSKLSRIVCENIYSDRAFLVYPSNGRLINFENIKIKNSLHENFNIKIDEVLFEESAFRVSCLVPNLKSSFLFKIVFI